MIDPPNNHGSPQYFLVFQLPFFKLNQNIGNRPECDSFCVAYDVDRYAPSNGFMYVHRNTMGCYMDEKVHHVGWKERMEPM